MATTPSSSTRNGGKNKICFHEGNTLGVPCSIPSSEPSSLSMAKETGNLIALAVDYSSRIPSQACTLTFNMGNKRRPDERPPHLKAPLPAGILIFPVAKTPGIHTPQKIKALPNFDRTRMSTWVAATPVDNYIF